MKIKLLISAVLILILSACGSSGGGPEQVDSGPPPIQKPGGLWRGIDSDGRLIKVLITENGDLHYQTSDGERAFGMAFVDESVEELFAGVAAVEMHFIYFPPLEFNLLEGNATATCTATGVLMERKRLDVVPVCILDAGGFFGSPVLLTYDTLYDRDSSLATIAGNWQSEGSADVLNISADGVIFSQDPIYGCVTNGEVGIIDPAYNAYDFYFTSSNCTGEAAFMNGAEFSGIAYLDNTAATELLTVTMTGLIDGATYSTVMTLPRT